MFDRWNRLTVFSLSLIVFMSSAIAQEGSTTDPRRLMSPENQTAPPNPDLPFFSPSDPQGCEINRLYLDDAGERARKIPNSYVIAIARLGTDEHSASLNRRRLRDVTNFLEQVAHSKVATAQGERVTGYGIIELYVGGKLLYKLPMARNRRIYLGSCEF